jgi:hypothetical protein
MKRLLLIITFLHLSLTSTFSHKVDSVNCYIQLQDLWDLDLNKASIKADFYLNLDYKHLKNKELDILNGTIIKLDTINDDDTLKTLSIRIIAELRTHFSYKRFPIDNQKIEIEIEPYQYLSELVLLSKPEQNIIVDTIHLNGWTVSKITCTPKVNKYRLVEKDGIKEYSYSALQVEIPILRKNKTTNFLKTFLPSVKLSIQ